MKFHKPMVLSLAIFVCTAHAEKISAGVYKSENGGELLTTIEKPCDSTSGNATLITAGKSVMACWVVDGDKIKVTWLDGSTSKLFDPANMVALGDIAVTPRPSATPTPTQPKAKKTHLT